MSTGGLPGAIAVLALIVCCPIGVILAWFTGWSRKTKAIITVIGVGLMLLWIVGSALQAATHSTAGQAGTQVASVDPAVRTAVIAATRAAIASCAQAAVASPVNCPQSADPGNNPSAMVWTLHGDPTAGAQVVSAGSGNYKARGHGVMTFTDTSGGVPRLQIVTFDYVATATYAGSQATITDLGKPREYDDQSALSSITQPRPSLSDDAAKAAVKAAFQHCAAATVGMTLACPASISDDPSNTEIHWSLNADPLLNTRVTYDSTYGLVHVVASYTMTVHYLNRFQPQSENFSGNYDAFLADDSGQAVVLMIKGR